MLHPHTEVRKVSDAVGVGVFATKFIPRGTIVWVRCALDRAFSPTEAARFTGVHAQILHTYAYHDGRGDLILCWDNGRFVNHSCEATMLAPGWDLEIAVRDLQPGDELTDDYATLNLDEPFECLCGAPQCRRVLTPDDTEHLAAVWDEKVAAAFPDVGKVEQPLWDLVQNQHEIEEVLAGRRPLPSIRHHLRPPRVAVAG